MGAYQAADFARCTELFGLIGVKFGHSKLAAMYIEACRKYTQWGAPVPEGFDGTITLGMK